MSVAGYGISTAYNYLYSNQSISTITQNAGYVNPNGTGGRLGQEMTGATVNSNMSGCDKALVDYGNASSSKLLLSAPYPPNNGAIHGTEHTIELQPGTIVDRYGKTTGNYLAPVNTLIEMRALPPNTNLNNYHQYRIMEKIKVESSIISPYYDKIGMGTQC